eukprot:4750863-Amphidinium_carterae.1
MATGLRQDFTSSLVCLHVIGVPKAPPPRLPVSMKSRGAIFNTTAYDARHLPLKLFKQFILLNGDWKDWRAPRKFPRHKKAPRPSSRLIEETLRVLACHVNSPFVEDQDIQATSVGGMVLPTTSINLHRFGDCQTTH